jgi:O-antigen/teichoic acid export membrane protein
LDAEVVKILEGIETQIESTRPEPMKTGSAIFRDASIYTVSTYIVQVITFITGIVNRRFLGPENIGIWTFLTLILSYLSLSHLGTIDGGGKEIPYWYGKGDLERAEKVKNCMYSFSLLFSIIAAIVAFILIVVLKSNIPGIPFLGFIVIIAALPMQQSLNSNIILFRSNKKFKLLSKTLIYNAGLNLIASVTIIVFFKLYGVYIAFLMILVWNLLYWRDYRKGKANLNFKLSFDTKELKYLLLIGFPLALYSSGWTFFLSLDRLFVTNYLGAAALGYYSLAVSINAYIYQTPNAFSIVMFPQFLERFGKTESKESLLIFITKPTIALSFFVIPFLIGGAFILVPVIVRQFIPAFMPGILPLKIFMAGTFFLSLTHMPVQFLITINKQLKIVGLTLFGVILNALFCYIAIRTGSGIVGVAVATSLAYFSLFLSVMIYALKHLMNFSRSLFLCMEILIPFFYTAFLLIGLDYFITSPNWAFKSDVAYGFMKLAIFLTCAVPMFWYANRKTEIIKRLFVLLKKKS